MAEITDLDVTDGNNTARFFDDQAASSYNDNAQKLEGLLARGFKDALEGTLTTAGSASAYTLASPNRTIGAYYAGLRFVLIANHSSTGASTLNVSSLGAKNILKPTVGGLVALVADDIRANHVIDVMYDGTQFVLLSSVVSRGELRNVQVFTGNGTYTPTTDMVYCVAEVVGGGGGSGGCGATGAGEAAAAGGGGGGGYATELLTASDIGASQTVTVGAGGTAASAGANNGGVGGTSSLGALLSATGGAGGSGIATQVATRTGGAGVVGGVGSGGDFNVNGGSSEGGLVFVETSITARGGRGGDSVYGGGAKGENTATTTTGNAGTNYGGGASGAASAASQAASAGSAGAGGIIIVWEYF